MGAAISCISGQRDSPKRRRRRNAPVTRARKPPTSTSSVTGLETSDMWRLPSGRKDRVDTEEALVHEQALAAAAALVLGQNGVSGTVFDRSASVRCTTTGTRGKGQGFARSSSARPRSLADPVLNPQKLVTQDLKIEDLETSSIVLVHGGGFGAWCWYKTIALLEESNFQVHAIDLMASGIHACDANKVTSLSEYIKPLTTFLETLADGKKVILVGHDLGGTCISQAMEMFPTKVSKAVFLCAAMLTSRHSTLNMFLEQPDKNDILQRAQTFVYSNGTDQPPTSINLDRTLLKDLFFNETPAKDVSLASVSMRPIPIAPVLAELSLTDTNYGSIPRFYIETTEDNTIPLALQQSMCSSNPPEKVFRLKGADHSPFFSKPQALHKVLIEISTIPASRAA